MPRPFSESPPNSSTGSCAGLGSPVRLEGGIVLVKSVRCAWRRKYAMIMAYFLLHAQRTLFTSTIPPSRRTGEPRPAQDPVELFGGDSEKGRGILVGRGAEGLLSLGVDHRRTPQAKVQN